MSWLVHRSLFCWSGGRDQCQGHLLGGDDHGHSGFFPCLFGVSQKDGCRVGDSALCPTRIDLKQLKQQHTIFSHPYSEQGRGCSESPDFGSWVSSLPPACRPGAGCHLELLWCFPKRFCDTPGFNDGCSLCLQWFEAVWGCQHCPYQL